MRAVVQRVGFASVAVCGNEVAKIGKGLMVLVGVATDDNETDASYITTKILGLRIFPDEEYKMNLDVSQADGEILVVSQFTLAGDARKGHRPDFATAAQPELAMELIGKVVAQIEKAGIKVQTGVFGAHMKVSLENDGPVTILLDSKRSF